MSKPLQRSHGHTYADYLGWDDDRRWELIDGEAFAMSPAPGSVHQAVSMELSGQIWDFLRDKPCRVFTAPFDVRLARGVESDQGVTTVVQPDLAVICDPTKIDGAGCLGAPDWIVEILSPSTAAHDQLRKRQLYERHGVREYWLVHPIEHLVWVYRLEEDGRYGAQTLSAMEGTLDVAVLPGLAIDWQPVLEGLAELSTHGTG